MHFVICNKEVQYESPLFQLAQYMQTQMDLLDSVHMPNVALPLPFLERWFIPAHQYWVQENEFEMYMQTNS